MSTSVAREERVGHPLAVALGAVVDQVAALVQDPLRVPAGGAGMELVVALQAQAGRLQVAAARLSTVLDDDGSWATEGARSFVHWLAAATGTSYARARELVAMGRALRDHLPETSAAALAGDVGVEQVATLARLAPTTEARRSVLARSAEECGEGFLLEEACRQPVEGFRRLVHRWAAAADPGADERGYREACDREFVALSATAGGYHLAGFLTTEHGATLNAALAAVMTAPTGDDARTTQQRRAQALSDVARLVLDHGLVGTGAAVRPHISCVVDFDSLRRAVAAAPACDRRGDAGAGSGARAGAGLEAGGSDCSFRLAPVADVERFAVGEILGAGPIPAGVLARLACDSEISRVVFGPDSRVINAGRAERTFTGPRRRAVSARYGTCRYPGCTAPPALGEVHHIAEWVRDHGETDVNLGILLCWHHHDLVHRLHVQIRRSPTGGWLFLTRHGDPVTAAV